MKRYLIIIALVILCVLFFIMFSQNNSSEESIDDSSSSTSEVNQPPGALSSVNPEERNSVLLKAGLPYENDSYAITYRFDDNQASGATIIVIDKIDKSIGSPNMRLTAEEYFKVRGININDLNVEYEIL